MWVAALAAMAVVGGRPAARAISRAETQVRRVAVQPVAQTPPIVRKVEAQEGGGSSFARMIAVQGVELDDSVVFKPYCQGHMGAAISFRF